MEQDLISGHIIQAYLICPRQAWFLRRQITGDQEHNLMATGRVVSKDSFKRKEKELQLGANKLDAISEKNGKPLIIEVKKSSKQSKSGILQLAYYLKILKESGIEALGELRIPREKKIIAVSLNPDLEKELDLLIDQLQSLFKKPVPPAFKKIGFCKSCSFRDFCLT